MVVGSSQCHRHKPEKADESTPAASVISQIYGGYGTTANVAHAAQETRNTQTSFNFRLQTLNRVGGRFLILSYFIVCRLCTLSISKLVRRRINILGGSVEVMGCFLCLL